MPLPSKIQQAYKNFNTKIDANDTVATFQLAQEWRKIESRMEEDFLDISELLLDKKKRGEPLPRAKILKLERYHSMLGKLDNELQGFGQSAASTIDDFQFQMANLGVDYANETLGIVNNDYGLNLNLNRLNPEAVRAIVAVSRQGEPLQQLLSNSYGFAANGITDELIEGVGRGYNPRKIARNIQNKGLSNGLNHVLLVSRDQALRAQRQGTLNQYRDIERMRGFQRLAAKNERTCPACLALDGEIWPIEKDLNIHPQDRCTLLPIIDGGPSWDYEKGRDWFNRQPRDVKQRIMGKEYFNAYENGEFEFSELATGKTHKIWGPSLQVTSLKDLRDGKGGLTTGFSPSSPPSAQNMRDKLVALEEKKNARIKNINNQIIAKDERIATDFDLSVEDFKQLKEEILILERESNNIHGEFAQKARELLYQDTEADITIRGLEELKEELGGVMDNPEKGIAGFKRLVGSGTELDGKSIRIKMNRRGSFYDYDNVSIREFSPPEMTVHELAHWYEDKTDKIPESVKFFNSQTKEESFYILEDNIRARVREDKFHRPYSGRIYYRGELDGYKGDIVPEKTFATEIISTGLEQMYANPTEFAKNNPEHFDFVWEVIRGIR